VSHAAAIAAAVRCSIDILVDSDDAAAVRVGLALDVWLRGTDFEASLGLLPGWRQHAEQKSRSTTLDALIRMHPGMKARKLADLILTGINGADCSAIRPDGLRGHFHDLKIAGCSIGDRQWRRDIAQARAALGHRLD
jgi:hypothetical protein